MTPQTKARIKWHCRRGMLELDLLLERFVDSQLDSLTEEQIQTFEALLNSPDPDLFAWLMGNAEPLDKGLLTIVECIRTNNNAG